jgi:hypothetical protein
MLKRVPVPEYECQVTKKGIVLYKKSSTPGTADFK